MIYEIINPSDAYTMKADDFKVAAVAVALLGNGQYGIKGTPILFGWNEFLKEQGINLKTFVGERVDEICAALDSVMIGKESDREEAESTLALIPEDKREAWLSERHERRRSSTNDIGKAAKIMAKYLRENKERSTP